MTLLRFTHPPSLHPAAAVEQELEATTTTDRHARPSRAGRPWPNGNRYQPLPCIVVIVRPR